MCLVKWLAVWNFLSHSVHKWLGSEWNSMWLFNCFFVLKLLLSGQTMHLNFLSSLWVAWCSCNAYFRANLLSQVEHTNGFSPVCVLLWISSLNLDLKSFRQTLHWWEILCIPIWLRRLFLLGNFFLQIRHSTFFSFVLSTALQSKIRYHKCLLCFEYRISILTSVFYTNLKKQKIV